MKFFEEYKKWLDTWGLNYTPNRIWNVDECDIPQPTAEVGITSERTFQTMSGETAEQHNCLMCECRGAGYVPTHYFQGKQDQA